MGAERRQRLLEAVTDVLRRRRSNIDPLALATAIDEAMGPETDPDSEGAYAVADEGKTPDQLNAANDQ